MVYRLELEHRARKELMNLPSEVQKLCTELLDNLQSNPRPPGAKKLTGQEGYRIRKGVYRILYLVSDKERVVRVYRIGHRREVYR